MALRNGVVQYSSKGTVQYMQSVLLADEVPRNEENGRAIASRRFGWSLLHWLGDCELLIIYGRNVYNVISSGALFLKIFVSFAVYGT